jgi:Lrp/AsnC family leucine-responsive transcriptional regulator
MARPFAESSLRLTGSKPPRSSPTASGSERRVAALMASRIARSRVASRAGSGEVLIRWAAPLPAMSIAFDYFASGVDSAYDKATHRVNFLVLAPIEGKSTVSDPPPSDRGLDRIDHKLLIRLQQDGRTAISKLAREVNLTVTPTLERVRRLEAAGYIEGYFARLSPRKLGLGLLAYVEVSLDRTTPDAFERFKQVMLAHDEVMECHMVAGGFDYLLKVRVVDMESYRRFLGDRIASVRGVQTTHTYFVMEEVKSTHTIVVPE